jgi:hypothetical protein
MIRFELLTKETAPEGALKGMETIERKVGFIPNLQHPKLNALRDFTIKLVQNRG